ncbi:tRNA pseudouridine synthase D [Anaeromyces robustus]|uniref:tRNA pseudouridine synthase D n=1 Tax=Anaeromyces robustus TaxID=1754192 RepID=A0A1Y1X042_9FUNG|nr:tRNA pseudouridine synthase D [Anaeromyces robustus]|eukprot:ORX79103.1 tRNA pseudouridine synthase D [Anaeromyces robustus]
MEDSDNKRKRGESIITASNPDKKVKSDSIIINNDALDSLKKSNDFKNDFPYEKDVGILKFINNTNPGFTVSLKQRYNDFLVNEIDEKGNIVHLTSLEVEKKEEEIEIDENLSQEEKDNRAFESLKNYIKNNDIIEQIKKIVNANGKDDSIVTTEDIPNKDERTKLHQFFRKHFSNRIETETKRDTVKISIHWANGKGTDMRSSQKGNNYWKQLGGEFCQFTMYKSNKETMNAINIIAYTLYSTPKCFGIAGTKDKRGITVQNVTGYHMTPEKIEKANKNLLAQGIQLGNFKFVKRGLKLGDLKGNLFNIVLRKLSVDNINIIDDAISSLKNIGFLNYFGMQRFGTTSLPTYEIGKVILKKNWKKAVDLILMEKIGESDKVNKARRIWKETHDPKKALEEMPKNCTAESAILRTFEKMGQTNVYSNALLNIPRNLRMMYVHAYQSYIWNMAATYHIEKYGYKPAVGDLVITEEKQKSMDDKKKRNQHKERPDIITSENINKYSIYDIVLPMPGHDIIYPDNEIKDYYEKLLKKDGINPKDMKTVNREYFLPGSYRKLIVKPGNVEWSVIGYNDEDADLAISDLDIINGKQAPTNIPNGKFKALQISFSLPSSSYATMALREVTKMDTSIKSLKENGESIDY